MTSPTPPCGGRMLFAPGIHTVCARPAGHLGEHDDAIHESAPPPGTPATTPRLDRFRVLSDGRPRLIGRVDYCICGGNPGVGGAQHEPYCGWDLIGYVDEILPAFAEIVAAREAAAEQRGAERTLRDVIERLRGFGVESAVVEHFTVLLAVQQNHAATTRAAAVAVSDTTHEGDPR